jgi:hypothetical protein
MRVWRYEGMEVWGYEDMSISYPHGYKVFGIIHYPVSMIPYTKLFSLYSIYSISYETGASTGTGIGAGTGMRALIQYIQYIQYMA